MPQEISGAGQPPLELLPPPLELPAEELLTTVLPLELLPPSLLVPVELVTTLLPPLELPPPSLLPPLELPPSLVTPIELLAALLLPPTELLAELLAELSGELEPVEVWLEMVETELPPLEPPTLLLLTAPLLAVLAIELPVPLVP